MRPFSAAAPPHGPGLFVGRLFPKWGELSVKIDADIDLRGLPAEMGVSPARPCGKLLRRLR